MATIGIDVDGTCANSIDPQLRLIEQRYGIKVTKEQINKTAPEESDVLRSSITKEQMVEMYRDVWKDYTSIKLEHPEIPAIIRKLKKKFDIHIITASIASLDNIQKWLSLNDIEFHKFTWAPNSQAKADVPNVELYVDDYQRVAEACAEKGKTVILLRQPWNFDFVQSNGHNQKIRHADDWPGIEGHVLEEHKAIIDRVLHLQRRPLAPARKFRSRH